MERTNELPAEHGSSRGEQAISRRQVLKASGAALAAIGLAGLTGAAVSSGA